jgi:hypothetical protein
MCQHFYGHKIKLLLATFRNQQVTCNHSLNDVVYGIEIKPNKKAIKTCLDRGLSTEVIKLR